MADILSPTTDFNTALTSQLKLLSDNQTSIQTKIASDNQFTLTSNVGQAGFLNLQGNLDASTKKTAILFAPVTNTNSPNARVSSSPQVNQAGGDNPLSGLLGTPNAIIALAAVGLALFFLTKPKTQVSSVRTGSISAKVPAGLG